MISRPLVHMATMILLVFVIAQPPSCSVSDFGADFVASVAPTLTALSVTRERAMTKVATATPRWRMDTIVQIPLMTDTPTVPGRLPSSLPDYVAGFLYRDESPTFMRVQVNYELTRAERKSVYVAAYALQSNGHQVPGTGYTPAPITLGKGTVQLAIQMVEGTGAFTSVVIVVCMVDSSGTRGPCETFPLRKSWGR